VGDLLGEMKRWAVERGEGGKAGGEGFFFCRKAIQTKMHAQLNLNSKVAVNESAWRSSRFNRIKETKEQSESRP
jgi:hypothetical protein